MNFKKVTATVLSIVLLSSTIGDVSKAYASSYNFTDMKNGKITQIGDVLNYSLSRDSDSFIHTNKNGNYWDGALWIFDGTGKASGDPAYCMALGKAASSSNSYVVVDGKEHAGEVSTKLLKNESKTAAVMNALNRYMYPSKEDSFDIEYYRTTLNSSLQTEERINDVRLIAKPNIIGAPSGWNEGFQIIESLSTNIAPLNISTETKQRRRWSMSNDEYRGLSQAAVWEMTEDLEPHNIGASVPGRNQYVHTTKGKVNTTSGIITGPLKVHNGKTGNVGGSDAPATDPLIWNIPTSLTKEEVASALGWTVQELDSKPWAKWVKYSTSGYYPQNVGAAYKLQVAMQVKATILNGTAAEGGHKLKYICDATQIKDKPGWASEYYSQSEFIGSNPQDSDLWLFEFKQVENHNLPLGNGGPLMVTPWCYMQKNSGEYPRPARDSNGDVQLFELKSNGKPNPDKPVGVVKGLKIFQVQEGGEPLEGTLVGNGFETGFVYAITPEDLEAALADDRFSEVKDGQRVFKQNIGTYWNIFNADGTITQTEKHNIGIAIPGQNRPGNTVTLQETATTQDLVTVFRDFVPISNGFGVRAPALQIKKVAVDVKGNPVTIRGGGFSIKNEDGLVVVSGLSVNENGYITLNGNPSNFITLPKGNYTLVEDYTPTNVDDPSMEFKAMEPVSFTVSDGANEVVAENQEKPKDFWLFGWKLDGTTNEVLEGGVYRLSKMRGNQLLGYEDVVAELQVPNETSEGIIPMYNEGVYVVWKIPAEIRGEGTEAEYGGPGTYVIHEIEAPPDTYSEKLGRTVHYEIPSRLAYPDGPGLIYRVGLNAEPNLGWWNRNYSVKIYNEGDSSDYGALLLKKTIDKDQYADDFSATFSFWDEDGEPLDLSESVSHPEFVGTHVSENKVKVKRTSNYEWEIKLPMLPLGMTVNVREDEVEPSPPFILSDSMKRIGRMVRIQTRGTQTGDDWSFMDPEVIKIQNRSEGLVNMELEKIVLDENGVQVSSPNPLIAGFKFKAVGEDGEEFMAYSGVTGKVTWTEIPKQKYTVYELEKEGWILPTLYKDGYEIDLTGAKDGETVRGFVPARNQKRKVQVRVLKVDKDTQEPLGGVGFVLRNTKTGEQTNHTTNPLGVMEFNDLPLDAEFELIETDPPKGYVGMLDIFTFDTKPNGDNPDGDVIKTYTLENEKEKGKVKIRKVDSSGTSLGEGVKFKLEKIDGPEGNVTKVIDDNLVTDANGIWEKDNLEYGWYRVTETQTKEGYILDPTPREVNIQSDHVYTVTMVNKPETGELRGQKVVESNPFDLSLAGAEFRLVGEGLDVTITSEADGSFVFGGLRFGEYTIQEIKAPNGFHMGPNSGEPTTFTISSVTKVVNWNSPKNYPDYGRVTIRKEPMHPTDTPLDMSGFTFKLYEDKDCTKLVEDQFVTDSDGNTKYSKLLPPGTYWFREEVANEDFVIDRTPVEVEVLAGMVKDYMVVKKNLRKGSIELTKYLYNSNVRIQGAEFQITKDGVLVETLVTDENGKAYSKKLEPGTYMLKETKVPEGFTWVSEVRPGFNDPKGVTFTISSSTQKLEFFFENDSEKGKILVYKQDKETKEYLKGAEFWLYDEGKKFTGRVANSNESGLAEFDNLDVNKTYYVKEKNAPDGYDLNYAEFKATLTPQEKEVKIYVENQKVDYRIIVKKYDPKIGTQTGLAGAVFQLYSEDGKPIGEPKTTDAAGLVTWTGLPEGRYLVKEVKPPTGYVDTGLSRVVDTKDATNRTIALQFQNQKEEVEEKEITLNLVKYGENISVTLAGVKFRLTNTDTGANWEYTTDKKGSISVTGLKPGNYRWDEISSVPGYLITKDGKPNTESFFVKAGESRYSYFFNDQEKKEVTLQLFKYKAGTTIPLAGAGFKLTGVNTGYSSTHYTGETGRITVTNLKPDTYVWEEVYAPTGYELDTTTHTVTATSSGETYSTTVYNKEIEQVTLRLLKLDSQTNQPLEGVKFQLRNKATGEIYLKQTDSYGQIIVTNLPFGEYELVELETLAGYILNTSPQTVSAYESREYLTTFYNNKQPVKEYVEIRLNKLDRDDDRPLEGAEFALFKDGQQIGRTKWTDEDGRIYWDNLDPGVYTIEEVTPPVGYREVYDNYWRVDASDASMRVFEQTIYNEKLKAAIELLKVDGDDNPLDGVEFELFNEKGRSLGTKITNRNGYIYWEDLKPGRYEIREVETLDGFILDREPYYLTVEAKETATVRWVNEREPKEEVVVTIPEKPVQPIQPMGQFQVQNQNQKQTQTQNVIVRPQKTIYVQSRFATPTAVPVVATNPKVVPKTGDRPVRLSLVTLGLAGILGLFLFKNKDEIFGEDN